MTAPEGRFALALQRLVATPADAGFAWSPYSVASALGITAAGARGETLAELTGLLGQPAPLAASLTAGAALPPDPDAGARLAVANTLWADLALPLAPAYLEAVKSWPGGSARGADFRNDPEPARAAINDDVERTTRGLITDLIQQGAVSADTVAVVVNALWLKAAWVSPFPRDRTRPRPFAAPGGTRDVPTMARTGRMPYAAAGGWTLVSLPARGDVVLDVLLPDGELAGAERALTPEALDGLLAAARPTEVALELPRFRVTGQAALKDPLAALGVRRLFERDADLSGITDGEVQIWVDEIVHKCVLTVDEEGLEGAAATAVLAATLAAMSPRPRPVPVRVDRPFLVLVRHRASAALYFLARVTTPH